MPALLVATRNEHKLRELREALPGIELEPLPAEVELPPEEGETFAENALGKARAAHAATGRPAIADDSGIEAHGLGGRPGVRSARYAGRGRDRRGEPGEAARARSAAAGRPAGRLRRAIALVDEDGSESLFEGRCEGTLVAEPRGSGGFGYDPAFIPDDTGPDDQRTMAELTPGGEERDQPPGPGRAEAGHAPGRRGRRMNASPVSRTDREAARRRRSRSPPTRRLIALKLAAARDHRARSRSSARRSTR